MSVIPAPPVSAPERASRARIPLTRPTGVLGSLLTRYAQRRYGQLPDNVSAFWHNKKVLFRYLRFEMGVAKWNALDPQLRILAEMAAAKDIECTWCIDFGYYVAHSQGLDTEKLSAVGSWRTSDLFTATERRVLEYSEAMTATPPAVTDEMAAALRADLGDAALVELTMIVGVENIRSRFNVALGLVSQGFSESCRVP
jgi:alkylhydroperoxidase family enzyme